MSYELPCGCILASLDACAIAWFGTYDFALLVERLTKGKEIWRYGVLSV